MCGNGLASEQQSWVARQEVLTSESESSNFLSNLARGGRVLVSKGEKKHPPSSVDLEHRDWSCFFFLILLPISALGLLLDSFSSTFRPFFAPFLRSKSPKLLIGLWRQQANVDWRRDRPDATWELNLTAPVLVLVQAPWLIIASTRSVLVLSLMNKPASHLPQQKRDSPSTNVPPLFEDKKASLMHCPLSLLQCTFFIVTLLESCIDCRMKHRRIQPTHARHSRSTPA